jgi:hypothetical protein
MVLFIGLKFFSNLNKGVAVTELERRGERSRNGRLTKRRLPAGGMRTPHLHLLPYCLTYLSLVACGHALLWLLLPH